MIQMRTMLKVADNSGARRIMAITPLGGSVGRVATHRRRHLRDGQGSRPREQDRQGQGHPGRHRPDPQGAPPQGRLLHPVRGQRRGHHRQGGRARRDARLRPRRARAPGTEVHEDHLPRAGGPVMSQDPAQEERPRRRHPGQGQGEDGQGPDAHPRDQPGHRREDQFRRSTSSRPTAARTSRAGSWRRRPRSPCPTSCSTARSAARASGPGRRRLEDGSKIRLCHRCETLIERQK